MFRKAVFALIPYLFTVPLPVQAEYRVVASELDDRKAVFGTVQSVDVVAARARIGGTTRGLGVDEGKSVV